MLVASAVWLAMVAVVLAANPHLGTWKLNESKSKFPPGAAKNTMITYTPAKR
jgi:hypothetical protein